MKNLPNVGDFRWNTSHSYSNRLYIHICRCIQVHASIKWRFTDFFIAFHCHNTCFFFLILVHVCITSLLRMETWTRLKYLIKFARLLRRLLRLQVETRHFHIVNQPQDCRFLSLTETIFFFCSINFKWGLILWEGVLRTMHSYCFQLFHTRTHGFIHLFFLLPNSRQLLFVPN